MQQTNSEGTRKRAKADILIMCTVRDSGPQKSYFIRIKYKQISCRFWISVPRTDSHACVYFTYNINCPGLFKKTLRDLS